MQIYDFYFKTYNIYSIKLGWGWGGGRARNFEARLFDMEINGNSFGFGLAFIPTNPSNCTSNIQIFKLNYYVSIFCNTDRKRKYKFYMSSSDEQQG